MKKFMILTAMALPLVFAGCNNEDDFGFTEQPSQELNTTVTGARIASHGMTIPTGANTRLDRTGWEKGDRLGVAWVVAKGDKELTGANALGLKFSGSAPTTPDPSTATAAYVQPSAAVAGVSVTFTFNAVEKTILTTATFDTTKWYEIDFGGEVYKNATDKYVYRLPIAAEQLPFVWTDFTDLTDNKIYANHMFEFNGGGFGYYGDIYEGAYFAYWPFTKLGKTEEMKFTLNNKQTIASSEAFYFKNALSISAIDSVAARNVAGEFVIKENVSKAFDLVKVANGISVNTKFVGNEDINNLKISEVKIVTTGKNLFTTAATLNPHKLPTAVYAGKDYNAEDTKAKMTLANLIGDDKALVTDAAVDNISTQVDMALNTANTVSILTFPTADGQVQAANVEIHVSVVNADKTVQGSFVIKYKDPLGDANAKANNDALSKLASLLNGGYTQNGTTYSLQDLNATYFNIPMNLMMADFQSVKEWKVADAAGWNKAVTEINALGLNSATIKLSDNLTFSTTVNPLFPTKAELTVTGGKAMTIAGEATINKNVKTATDVAMSYNLMKGAKLTIAEDATVLAHNITVEGTLNVNGTINNDAITGVDAITIVKSVTVAGVMNLGAKGVIGTAVGITNGNVINVTEGTKNSIVDVTGGKVIAEVTNGANAANIMQNVKATEVTFNGATVDVALVANITYFTKGNTTFSGALGSNNVALTVSEGTLTFSKGASITLGDTSTPTSSKTVTVATGAKMVIATGTDGVTMYDVSNNGVIDLQKDDMGNQTTWKTGTVSGKGSINLNDNIRQDI